jgi:predicted esterase
MNRFLLSFLLLILFFNLKAQQKAEQYNITVNYLLYLPQEYGKDTSKLWPVMIFLHGSGQSGTDIQKVKTHGPPKLIEQGKQYPFIVVSPQARENEGWEPQVIIRLIKGIQSQYKVDKERIYLTGLSMGGFGTWNIASKFPSVFAAIAPVCGGGDTTQVMKLKHVPVWCFHGAKDNVVNPEQSYRMVRALKKFNPDVKLTIYPDANHDSWTQTYNNDSLYTWMLQHKKFHFPRMNLSEKQLTEYAGTYVQKTNDTLRLVVQDGKLVVKEQPGIELVPTASNSFFVMMNDVETEVKFKRDIRRKIDKLLVIDDNLVEFKKVE